MLSALWLLCWRLWNGPPHTSTPSARTRCHWIASPRTPQGWLKYCFFVPLCNCKVLSYFTQRKEPHLEELDTIGSDIRCSIASDVANGLVVARTEGVYAYEPDARGFALGVEGQFFRVDCSWPVTPVYLLVCPVQRCVNLLIPFVLLHRDARAHR